jgi:hypothetical protein
MRPSAAEDDRGQEPPWLVGMDRERRLLQEQPPDDENVGQRQKIEVTGNSTAPS